MGDLIAAAASILEQSTRRVEVAADNISNITTPAHRRRVGFSSLLTPDGSVSANPTLVTSVDFSLGQLRETKNPDHLGLASDGFFVVRSGEQTAYTRNGQFERQADGRLVNAQGYALQVEGGGDLVLRDGPWTVAPDGVASQEAPLGRIAVVDFDNRGSLQLGEGGLLFAKDAEARPVEEPALEQAMLESSNVSTGAEMLEVMQALRHAETGQRLTSVYDELLGRAASTFIQN